MSFAVETSIETSIIRFTTFTTMLIRTLPALVAFIAGASASSSFKGVSPYLLFSTSSSPVSLSTSSLVAASDALSKTSSFLSTCPSDIYIFVNQPNVNKADIELPLAVPHLQRFMRASEFKSKLTVPDLVGEITAQDIQDVLTARCGATVEKLDVTGNSFHLPQSQKSAKPVLLIVNFPAPVPAASTAQTKARAKQLRDHDDLLASLMSRFSEKKSTVIYSTTPVQVAANTGANPSHSMLLYNPQFVEGLHMDLKRGAREVKPTDGNGTMVGTSLFDRYQFFTPGLFMGLAVTFLLLSILGVGISALGSLQVSYGAFDKEMGPAAQKKIQ